MDRVAGAWVLVLIGARGGNLLTLTDFVVEIAVRKQLGSRGRTMIRGMGTLRCDGREADPGVAGLVDPSNGARSMGRNPAVLQRGLVLMAVGVLLSGLRDLYAALELPYGSWPWKLETAPP
jgi:hypothetical protein